MLLWTAYPCFTPHCYRGLITKAQFDMLCNIQNDEVEFNCKCPGYSSCCLDEIEFRPVTYDEINTLKRCGIDMDHDLIDIIDPRGVIFKNH